MSTYNIILSMKYYVKVMCLFLCLFGLFNLMPANASLPLQGKVIVVDAGHGGLDPGTTYKDIYEKDINLAIAKYLEEALSKYGATVVLTRENDADLSSGVKTHRKKKDFDERIKIINNKYSDMYLSIHLNYLTDTKYSGAQVFYNKENEKLAEVMQKVLNKELKGSREIKKIPTSTYMYDKLKTRGILIECGFLSNYNEREKLKTKDYQKKVADAISLGIIEYYK